MVQIEHGSKVDLGGTMEALRSSSDDTVETALGASEKKPEQNELWNWDDDPSNPYNWPTSQKVLQVMMIGWAAFTTLVNPSA